MGNVSFNIQNEKAGFMRPDLACSSMFCTFKCPFLKLSVTKIKQVLWLISCIHLFVLHLIPIRMNNEECLDEAQPPTKYYSPAAIAFHMIEHLSLHNPFI